ncbi:MAG: AarF/ABC1/UbiB kinase family protein [Terracidiphilus sp.]
MSFIEHASLPLCLLGEGIRVHKKAAGLALLGCFSFAERPTNRLDWDNTLKGKWVPTPLLRRDEAQRLIVRASRPACKAGVLRSVGRMLHFASLIVSLKFRRITELQKAAIVRRFIEQKGGLWVKIAQTLASRHDAIPPVYCEELGKLFDSADSFPWEEARAAIEGSLGRRLEDVFSEFSQVPIAAASIAQVYRARLHHGNTPVAVKVRRPDIQKIFGRDLAFLRIVASILSKFGSLSHLHLLDMYGELEQMITEELDFRVEATLIRDMRRNLKPREVQVPRVFHAYCTREVLVMSFIDGVLMSDYLRVLSEDPVRAIEWQNENKIKPKRLARKIYLSCQRQVFEDNLFHGDLHPGNIMLLRKGRFALLDFGAVGTLDLSTRQQVRLYHQKVAEGDISKAMMVLTHMSSPVPRANMAGIIRQLTRVTQSSLRMMAVKGLPYEERIYSNATSQQLRILGKAKIPISWDFLRAQRTFTVLEMSLRNLDPSIEPMKLSRAYFRARARRIQTAAGGRHHQLIDRLESIVENGQEVVRNAAEGLTIAGTIWGRDLNDVRAFVGRTFARIWLQGTIFVGLLFVGAAIEAFMPQWVPKFLQPILHSLEKGLSVLPVIAWALIAIVIVLCIRWARSLLVRYSLR